MPPAILLRREDGVLGVTVVESIVLVRLNLNFGSLSEFVSAPSVELLLDGALFLRGVLPLAEGVRGVLAPRGVLGEAVDFLVLGVAAGAASLLVPAVLIEGLRERVEGLLTRGVAGAIVASLRSPDDPKARDARFDVPRLCSRFDTLSSIIERMPRREELLSRLLEAPPIFAAVDCRLLGVLPVAFGVAGSAGDADVARPCLRFPLLLRDVLEGLRTLLLLCFLWLLLVARIFGNAELARVFGTAELARFRPFGVLPRRSPDDPRFLLVPRLGLRGVPGIPGSTEGARLDLAMPRFVLLELRLADDVRFLRGVLDRARLLFSSASASATSISRSNSFSISVSPRVSFSLSLL